MTEGNLFREDPRKKRGNGLFMPFFTNLFYFHVSLEKRGPKTKLKRMLMNYEGHIILEQFYINVT